MRKGGEAAGWAQQQRRQGIRAVQRRSSRSSGFSYGQQVSRFISGSTQSIDGARRLGLRPPRRAGARVCVVAPFGVAPGPRAGHREAASALDRRSSSFIHLHHLHQRHPFLSHHLSRVAL